MIERRTWVQPQAIMVSGLCSDSAGVVSPSLQSSLRVHTGPPSSHMHENASADQGLIRHSRACSGHLRSAAAVRMTGSSPAMTKIGLGHRFADCNRNDWGPGPFALRSAQPLASARRATVRT
jgi:hypothetical protein